MVKQIQTKLVEADADTVYDGLDLFEEESHPGEAPDKNDLLKKTIAPVLKAYGEEDGRHKRK